MYKWINEKQGILAGYPCIHSDITFLAKAKSSG